MKEGFHLSSIGEFLDSLSSKTPTPGGGSAAALMGATGASLGIMACRFTTGEKFKAHVAEIETAINSLLHLRGEIIPLIDADAGAFNKVSTALKLPKETEEQKIKRKHSLHQALRAAMEVPYRTMDLSIRCLQILERHALQINANLASDLATASLSLGSAVEGAWLNVLINQAALGDDSEGLRLRAEAEKARLESQKLTSSIMKTVNEALK